MKRVRKTVEQPKLPFGHTYSFSQLNTYISCPRKYKYQYFDRVERVGFAPPMIFGSSMHEYFEGVLLARLQDHEMTSNTRTEYMMTTLNKMLSNVTDQLKKYCDATHTNPSNVPFKFNLEHLKIQFRDLAMHWNKEILPDIHPVAVEKEIRIQLVDNISFVMYIDLIRQIGKQQQIVDWKVSKKTKGTSVTASSLQLSTYSMATGIPNVAFCSIIRSDYNNKWAPRIEMESSTRHPLEIEWAREVIRENVAAIEKEIFPCCSPENYLCSSSFCDFWDMCRGKYARPKTKSPSWMSHG